MGEAGNGGGDDDEYDDDDDDGEGLEPGEGDMNLKGGLGV